MIQTCFRREETGEESHEFRLTSGRSFIRDGEGGIWDQIPVLAPAEGAQPGLQSGGNTGMGIVCKANS